MNCRHTTVAKALDGQQFPQIKPQSQLRGPWNQLGGPPSQLGGSIRASWEAPGGIRKRTEDKRVKIHWEGEREWRGERKGGEKEE